jgi:hypothetical protein
MTWSLKISPSNSFELLHFTENSTSCPKVVIFALNPWIHLNQISAIFNTYSWVALVSFVFYLLFVVEELKESTEVKKGAIIK